MSGPTANHVTFVDFAIRGVERLRTAAVLLAVLMGLGPWTTAPTWAEPFVPINDDQVLERVRPEREVEGWRSARRLRSQLRQHPGDRGLAVRYASQALELARALGDPRHIGYAQAALEPWLDDPDPPVDVRLLRARMLQSHHDFEAALDDLDHVLERRPRTPSAWLSRAMLLTVQGEPAAARGSCTPLTRLGEPLLSVACRAHVEGLLGRARESHDALFTALETTASVSRSGDPSGPEPSVERFVLGILIDQAHRLGETELAESYFVRLQTGPGTDVPGLVQWADVLLDLGRDREVVELLRDDERVDALLLRRALALSRLWSPKLEGKVAALSARFDAAERRGEDHHQGEASRFHLHLLGDVDQALDLALGNWRQQREPADARRLLEAALAANDPSAAEPVLLWRQSTSIEDLRLDRLARALAELEVHDAEVGARDLGGSR